MSDDADKAEILAALSARGLVGPDGRGTYTERWPHAMQVNVGERESGFSLGVRAYKNAAPADRFMACVTVCGDGGITRFHATATAAVNAVLRLAARKAKKVRLRLDAVELAIATAAKKARSNV